MRGTPNAIIASTRLITPPTLTWKAVEPVRRQVRGVEDHAGVHDLVGAVHAEDVEHARLVADRGELERHVTRVVADHEPGLRDEGPHVEHDDVPARVEKRAHEVAADEAGAACDEGRSLARPACARRRGADVDLRPRHPLLVPFSLKAPSLSSQYLYDSMIFIEMSGDPQPRRLDGPVRARSRSEASLPELPQSCAIVGSRTTSTVRLPCLKYASGCVSVSGVV